MAEEKDVTFEFNKYGDQKLLDLKESVAQQIINALFMIPGNLPSLPHIGVNIKQYLYKTDTSYNSTEIEQKLKEACGAVICGVVINSVDFSVQKTSNGQSVFLIMIRITFPNNINSILGVSVVQANEIVKFNFAYAGNT